jgi:homoserine kinase type II
MARKTEFSEDDFGAILLRHSIGDFVDVQPIARGSVQTNYVVRTTEGKFIFKCYENRTEKSAQFEIDLLWYLKQYDYPCPVPIDTEVGRVKDKPYAFFSFIEGHHVEAMNERQRQQLIQRVAELQTVTADYDPPMKRYRWNYSPELCRQLAHARAEEVGTLDARRKCAWLESELETLELPASLPLGICHCDFDLSNLFFSGDELVGLLDFDDANYTYLSFDVVNLLDWPYPSEVFEFDAARATIREYSRHRTLAPVEQAHLFDIEKLAILIDCIWYFHRGTVDGCHEKRKIDYLNRLGRDSYMAALFPENG